MDFEVDEIAPVEAWKRASEENALVVDVRETEEVAQVSVIGALHIPLGELVARRNELPEDRDLLLLCHSGQRSALATDFLRQTGHARVWNVQGGIVAWWKAGLPLVESWDDDPG